MAEIKAAFPEYQLNFEVEPGPKGCFELFVDGERLWSKLEEQRRFPGYREIPKMLKEHLPLPPKPS